MGSATSTTHVRNFFSREFTAGVGEETWRLLPESAYLMGMVELSLDAQFVQNPFQMTFNWSLRHDGATLTSGFANEWETFRYVWDTMSSEDGAYDVEMCITRPNQEDVVLARRYYVLNTSCIAHFNEEIDGDVVWKNDGKVHVVIGKLTIKNGGSLVVEAGAIVKFVDDASLIVENGGSLDLSGVVLTHFADDKHGGDTNGDSAQSMPQYNKYSFMANSQAEVITDADTEFCYMSMTSYGRITKDTLWPGNCLVNVTDDVTVASGATLTILPGAIIKMAAGKSITVQSGGMVNAVGNRAQPIVFTSVKDDEHGGDTNDDGAKTTPQPGDWGRINITGGTVNLSYTQIYYSGTASPMNDVIYMDSGLCTLDSCIIAHAIQYVAGLDGGTWCMRNSIFYDFDTAFRHFGSNSNINCIFYDFGNLTNNGSMNFTNCVIMKYSRALLWTNWGSESSDNSIYRNCVIWNPADCGPQSSVKTGRNGNIWADPKFVDAENWNFQLYPNSPCIDAGDGTVANLPEKDYYGNPRSWSDGRVTPTGVADANGNYPDIGLFEMCGDMDSDLDVAVNWIEGPSSAMAGDTVTVRWQLANVGTVTGIGVRRDNIYLVSKDERLGNRRVFVATATLNSRLASNGIMTYTFDKATIPPVTPGKWGFAVFANEERDWFEGRNINNNYLLSAGDCEISLPTVTCTAQGTTLTVNAGENSGFHLTNVPAEGAVLIVRGDGMDVTGQFGYLPETIAQGWKSVNLGNGTVLLTIPPVVGNSDVFILLENTGNEDTSVELSSLTGSFALFDNGVTTASNLGTVTIPLYGIGLTADMDVYLKQGAARIDASSLTVAENGAIYATFDVAGAAVGSWTLYASNENGSGSLDALTLKQAMRGPRWWCKLELPSAIRRGRTVIGTFVYGNSGDVDMDAPYVKIEGETGVNVRLSENDAWGKSIEFMALSGTYPVSHLKAREERRQTFEFIQLNDNLKVNIKYEYVAKKLFDIFFNYFSGYYTRPTPFPWDTNSKLMRPDWVTDSDWKIILDRLKSSIGPSWNSYFDRVRANADYLALLGQSTNDLAVLWQMDVREAMATDNAVATLASSTDLVREGRGFNIMVSRRFGSSMKTRNHIGMFGKGWAMSYETKVVLKDDGETLAFEVPSGSSYTFSKATGTWRSTVVGDKTQLEETNSAYILYYQDGSVATFAKAIGRMISTRDCNGNGLDFRYSGKQLNQIIHTDGQWVKFTYNGSHVSKMEDDLGHIVTYRYSDDKLAAVTGISGLTTQYSYDNRTDALKSIIYPDRTTRDYTFDNEGRVATISRNGNQQTVTIDRGLFGSYAVIDADGAINETVVGASGEVLYTIDALGNRTTYHYDNDVAAVTSIQTATGRTVHYDYDKDFNVTRSVGPDGTATQFTYSVDFGGLERYTDARGQTVAYAYDDKGQGIGNMLADGRGGSLEYNEKGDVISTTDRSGRNRTMEYDAQGRLIRSTDADNRSQDLVYDAKGNVVKLKDSLLGDTTMSYTPEERVENIMYSNGLGFSYEYDAFGRMLKQTYSDGFVQNYEYDALGRVSKMTDKNGKLLVALEYDAVTGVLLSKTFGNDTSVHYAYDLNGNLLYITHKGKDGSVLESFQYIYDADGRRTQVESSEGVEAYTYDMAGQLTAVTYPDGTMETFQYDAVGNRVSANGEAYTVNELNQYLTAGDATFTYDDNGNMASRTDANGTTTYEYDVHSRLVRVVRSDGKAWSCQYDALGNRTQVNDNGQIRKQLYTLGSLPSLAAEYNASGKLIRRYILLGSTLIADVDASGNYRYYHADGLGSIRLLTNDAGAVVSRQSYNAFGGLRMASGENTRLGYVGTYGVEVDATGLVFMRNRYYDASLGCFMQLDPIGIYAGDVNWYRYCDNDVVNNIDLLGTDVICESFNSDNGKYLPEAKLVFNVVMDLAGLGLPFGSKLFKGATGVAATTMGTAISAKDGSKGKTAIGVISAIAGVAALVVPGGQIFSSVAITGAFTSLSLSVEEYVLDKIDENHNEMRYKSQDVRKERKDYYYMESPLFGMMLLIH